MKEIMVIDDSALMRRMVTDILTSDERFKVTAFAKDGVEALEILAKRKFDVIILDVHMPRMGGIQFLEELKLRGMKEKVVVMSSMVEEGGPITIKALELGAVDFIEKPHSTRADGAASFKENLLNIVDNASKISKDNLRNQYKEADSHAQCERAVNAIMTSNKTRDLASKGSGAGRKKIVALASSTGGPGALQHVIPYLPKNLAAPVMIVQHMPKGFTKSLAERLDSQSEITVTEAEEGDVLQNGHVYLAKGGQHMKCIKNAGHHEITLSDEPTREGVKPCANYMYESLANCDYDEVICVVLTGMGQDGTEGISNLSKSKKIYCIAQSEATCTVYGMPRAIVRQNLATKICDLDMVAASIIEQVGIN